MQQELATAIKKASQDLFSLNIEPELTRPEEQFGDYSTNLAMKLAAKTGQPPKAVAEKLVEKLSGQPNIAKAEAAGPGFINITLTDKALLKSLSTKPGQPLKGQVVVAEYSDPNPFKILHAGHIYTTVVGEAIAQLLEFAGATVHRVNFGGDVGLHVAKSMWAILQELGGEEPLKLQEIPKQERTKWLSARYIEGNAAYKDNPEAKTKITEYNKRIYQIQRDNDHASAFAQIYWTGRQWSYEAFDVFYARLGTKLEKYYPESEVADLGLETVRKHIGKIFEESDGAIVFKGEPYGLHTRVFINSEGLPTYEAKDVGLIIKKYQDYHFDRSVVVTDNEQQTYMAVVLKAIEQFLPELAAATTYIPHGKVKLLGGVKMSSRLGNIVPAHEVLDVTAAATKKAHGSEDEQVVLAAVKYAFLKQRIGGDIIYDPKESVSLEGNSGPYLQYAYVRALSILQKVESGEWRVERNSNLQPPTSNLESSERSLARKISEYPEVVEAAVNELMPHHVATYLYELAQNFNRFYEANRIIGDEREALRLKLVEAYANILKSGLGLLNIPVPEKM